MAGIQRYMTVSHLYMVESCLLWPAVSPIWPSVVLFMASNCPLYGLQLSPMAISVLNDQQSSLYDWHSPYMAISLPCMTHSLPIWLTVVPVWPVVVPYMASIHPLPHMAGNCPYLSGRSPLYGQQ